MESRIREIEAAKAARRKKKQAMAQVARLEEQVWLNPLGVLSVFTIASVIYRLFTLD